MVIPVAQLPGPGAANRDHDGRTPCGWPAGRLDGGGGSSSSSAIAHRQPDAATAAVNKWTWSRAQGRPQFFFPEKEVKSTLVKVFFCMACEHLLLSNKPLWRREPEDDDETDGSFDLDFNSGISAAQKNYNLEMTTRPELCSMCPNRFCIGCFQIKAADSHEIKQSEIVKFARNFKMLPGERKFIGSEQKQMYKMPFTVPPEWSGSIVASALHAANIIPGYISAKKKQKVNSCFSLFEILR